MKTPLAAILPSFISTRELTLAFVLLAFAFGCKKSPAPTASAPPADNTSAVTATGNAITAPAAQPGVVLPGGDAQALLAAMTQVLRRYVFEHRGAPKSFEEFAASGYLQRIPPAPPGQKFSIDKSKMEVILVKR